jgi:hypothetical protein
LCADSLKAAAHAQPLGCRFDILHRIEYAPKVRTRSSAQLLMFALLAFQLAFGLQQSAGAPHPDTAPYARATHHAEGTGVARYADVAYRTVAAHHAAAQLADSTGGSMTAANDDGGCPLHAPTPDNKHDCCKASGCQCQCGYVSLAVNLDGPRGIPASKQVQPIATVRFATAPADTLFRPPIRA